MKLKHFCVIALLAAGAALTSACSEENGWTIVEYKGAPYGESRTVGSGIKYVRAYLLPEKGPVTDPIMEEVDALLKQHMETAHINMPSAEPMFNKGQVKN